MKICNIFLWKRLRKGLTATGKTSPLVPKAMKTATGFVLCSSSSITVWLHRSLQWQSDDTNAYFFGFGSGWSFDCQAQIPDDESLGFLAAVSLYLSTLASYPVIFNFNNLSPKLSSIFHQLFINLRIGIWKTCIRALFRI